MFIDSRPDIGVGDGLTAPHPGPPPGREPGTFAPVGEGPVPTTEPPTPLSEYDS